MKQILVSITSLVFLAACGGGSVEISNFKNPEGMRPAKRAVEDLENASTPEARKELLQAMAGARGKGLDWAGFWELLAESPIAETLLATDLDALLALQSQGCEARIFERHARFILKFEKGWDYLIGKNRACTLPLGPELTERVVGGYLKTTAVPQDETLLDFVRTEMERDAASRWSELFASSLEARLEKVVARSTDKSIDTVISFLDVYHRGTSRTAFFEFLQNRFWESPQFLAAYLTRQGNSRTVETLELLSRVPSKRAWRTTPDVIRGSIKKLIIGSLVKIENTASVMAYQIKLRRLAQQVSARWALPARLELLELLQAEMETWFAAQTLESKERLAAEWLAPGIAPGLGLDIVWAVRRMEVPVESPLLVLAKESLGRLAGSGFQDATDRVILGRLAIHFAETPSQRRAHALEFCREFEREGVPTHIVTAENFTKLFARKLEPGCYRVNGAATLVAENPEKIEMAYDSLLNTPGTHLTLRAPTLNLSLLDLTTEQTLPLLPLMETPANFDARAFPIVVGLVLPESRRYAPKGTHFLTLHFTQRAAQEGPADPTLPQQGLAGGNLELQAATAPTGYVFISEGGPGQAAAPRRKGGKADTSMVDPAIFPDWVVELEAFEKDTRLIRPFNFTADPAHAFIEDLFAGALRNEKGEIFAFVQREYLNRLEPKQVEKMQAAAEEILRKPVKNEDLLKLVETTFAPQALKAIAADLAERQAAPNYDGKALSTITSASTVFEAPAGKLGPLNATGAVGNRGEIHIKGLGDR